MCLVKRIVAATLVFGIGVTIGLNLAVAEVVAVVSAKTTMTALTKNQITDIFLGKTSRFPDGRAAIPLDQLEGSVARDEFYARFAGKSAAQVKAHWSKIIFTGRGQPPKQLSNSNELRRFLNDNPAAISYIDKSAVDDSIKVLTILP